MLKEWGAEVIERISTDLQKKLPGLKGFSYSNLIKMKQFYMDYRPFSILPSSITELAIMNGEAFTRSVRAELHTEALEVFWLISFSHHIELLGKHKTDDESLFFMAWAA